MIRIFITIGLVLVLTALIAAIFSGLGHRWGWWSFGSGFAILKWAVYAAAVALIIAVLGMYFTRPGSGQSGFIWAVLICILSAALVSVPALWLYRAQQVPRIHDITTDTQEPPQFVAVLALRQDAPNATNYAGIDIARQQQQAYPDINSLLLPSSPENTYYKALAAVKALGWVIVAAVPEDKRIEATDTTFWFGFKDDIVIRIRAADGGSRLDIRSVSRVGLSDVGTNARRIRAFLKLMQ